MRSKGQVGLEEQGCDGLDTCRRGIVNILDKGGWRWSWQAGIEEDNTGSSWICKYVGIPQTWCFYVEKTSAMA